MLDYGDRGTNEKVLSSKKVQVLLVVVVLMGLSGFVFDAIRPKHNEFVKGTDTNYLHSGSAVFITGWKCFDCRWNGRQKQKFL